MATDPQPTPFRPSTAIDEVADFLADPVPAADFPRHILRFRNDRAAAQVGLDDLGDEGWTDHFGRFLPLPGSLPSPLALRYHGHQFRVYNPDIGDGRGFLFAQMHDSRDRLMDLGTKGSGRTPYSRFGDGRLTLKGGLREILATEMLEALGVETSRTFSLVETGEALQRGDEPSPTRSSVLVRLSHSHIRIGSFQRLATLGLTDEMTRLAAYCLRHLFGEEPGAAPELRLLEHVVAGAARLTASYMAAGFVHGVLNTDNINVTAESFDYGPWRFTPYWELGFTAAYFDHQGLYAFGRQAHAIHWNVVQLAIAFSKIHDPEVLAPILDSFPATYEAAIVGAMLGRLGIARTDEVSDLALVQAIEEALGAGTVTIDRFFFDWAGGRRRGASPADPAYDAPAFAALATMLETRSPSGAGDHAYWSDANPCSMHIEEVEAIWGSIDREDDWSPLHAKVAAIRRMGDALARLRG
ncbi:protein adenylyltransferase SelO family protein [Sphingomonas sp.]|uniref:protein adenylyltransferase SelO family protein n=1 Tax=Sphingomonas sp. TaxID=28214 RepID=UPI000DB0758A|nr:YdiU family protein [Sphingomonas sp.]PZU09689.1 MAG: YdiU family protein [Sphingomonas sp.]